MFSFSSRVTPSADTGDRLTKCIAHADGVKANLAEAEKAYERAVARNAEALDVKGETLEIRRAHDHLMQARAVAARADDSVRAAQTLHRAALAREQSDAENRAWDQVEAAAKARTEAAQAFSAAATAAAERRREFEDKAAVHAQALSLITRNRTALEVFHDFKARAEAELGRVGAVSSPQKIYGLAAPQSLVEFCEGLEKMTHSLREQAHTDREAA